VSDTTLWEFQSLFFQLRDEAAVGWGEEIVLPWLDARPHCLAELRELGRPDSHRNRVEPDPDHFTALEGLYALGRVIDVLIAPHQPVNDDPELLAWTTGAPWWEGRLASASAWRPFCAALGATLIAESSFHPFFHEIVDVQVADAPDEPPSLVAEHWPGALRGGLLLVRSGVTVRAGTEVLNRQAAARSCLYWTWWRRNRVARDLSHGWGHNSQWRTDFRRDYLADDHLHYNVDATGDERDSELNAADRLELLRHRTGLRDDFGTDQWPYHETFVEPAPGR
jgi:hypothetical protein